MSLSLLTKDEFVCFTTREFATEISASVSAASKQLSRLKSKGIIDKITKGLWIQPNHPYFSELSCVPKLLGKEQGYISFLTALHRHGVLSQIPRTIQVATTGHSRILKTKYGTYEFFQIKPEMMTDGIAWTQAHCAYRLARVEKALLDTFYISTRKNARFSSLPELELNSNTFKLTKFNKLLKQSIHSKQINSAILKIAATKGIILLSN